uniref:Uncharacterized protein n=1 Tax=Aegilops tauschii subsp. strangulata TaxID=200361 RepID=A0A453B2A1_AEGTS
MRAWNLLWNFGKLTGMRVLQKPCRERLVGICKVIGVVVQSWLPLYGRKFCRVASIQGGDWSHGVILILLMWSSIAHGGFDVS